MKSGIGKKRLNLFLLPLLLIPVGIMDWDFFFPPSTRSDLVFQATGELIELAGLVGATFLISFGIEKIRQNDKRAGSWLLYRFLIAAAFASFLLALGWRDLFPNDQLSLSAVHPRHLAGVILGALIFASVGSSLNGMRTKPSGENEKSVV